uniref:Uncharacterized protein n=1 Tax=Heterorhabditis bacteriophora TaxID=37862 RepID=A0A1I7WE38_HETBA
MSEIIFGFHPRDTLLGKVRRMRRRSSFVPAPDRRKELFESPVQTSKDSHSSTAAQTLIIIRFPKEPQLYHEPSSLRLLELVENTVSNMQFLVARLIRIIL